MPFRRELLKLRGGCLMLVFASLVKKHRVAVQFYQSLNFCNNFSIEKTLALCCNEDTASGHYALIN
jgi:hypothetical protein